eukprot:364466-Chlamydomonas_euryale.AAC.6
MRESGRWRSDVDSVSPPEICGDLGTAQALDAFPDPGGVVAALGDVPPWRPASPGQTRPRGWAGYRHGQVLEGVAALLRHTNVESVSPPEICGEGGGAVEGMKGVGGGCKVWQHEMVHRARWRDTVRKVENEAQNVWEVWKV